MRWTVVMPVKGGPLAKSRLRPLAELALPMALDVVAAARGCSLVDRVLVVTRDRAVARSVHGFGADVIADRGAGLDAAVSDGARTRRGAVVVLLADLPCLRSEDLREALAETGDVLADGAPMALVPDTDGAGTVMLSAATAAALDPAFGRGSARRHVLRGAATVATTLDRLRRDVDTTTDLVDALCLGVGPRTLAALPASWTTAAC